MILLPRRKILSGAAALALLPRLTQAQDTVIRHKAVVSYVYPGDAVASPTAAYSTRKLLSAYAGNCLKIRRSSDNTEQDIGFVGTALDTASLLTFCGAGNGFVRTWYDQSGNGRNLGNATQANQPQLVSSGAVIVTIGTQPSLKFDGSNDRLVSTAALSTLLATTQGTVAAIFRVHLITTTSSFTYNNDGLWAESGANCGVNFHNTTPNIQTHNNDGNNDTVNVAVVVDTNYLHIWKHDTGHTLSSYLTSSTPSTGTSNDTTSLAGTLEVGCNFIEDQFYDGHLAELIFYNTALSAGNIATLGAAMIAPYGISWS